MNYTDLEELYNTELKSDDFLGEEKSDNIFSSKETIDRQILQRNKIFKYDEILDNITGEITGDKINFIDLEQGMPTRYFMKDEIDKNISNNERNNYNPGLDFDLFEEKPNNKISYFDPQNFSSKIETQFSDVGNNNKIFFDSQSNENIDPNINFSSLSNQFSLDLLSRFNSSANQKSLGISPLSLLVSLQTLYRGSKGNTERELKNFFNFSNKNLTFSVTNNLLQKLYQTKALILFNMHIFPNNYPINMEFAKYIKRLSTLDTLNNKLINKEILRINNFVKNITNGVISTILDKNMLTYNSNIICISTFCFHSPWKFGFDIQQTLNRKFFSTNSKLVPMMIQHNHHHLYFEDEFYQILEMQFSNPDLSMGFLLPKTKNPINIDNNQLQYYISNLKNTTFSVIQIPRFKQQAKFKIDNLFKKMGLTNIFSNADLSDITPNNKLYISDVIHQTFIYVNEQGSLYQKNIEQKSNNIKINFIANHPFLYYVRYKPLNIIIFIGYYY